MKEKLKALWGKLNTDVSSLWAESKFFVIAFGAILLALKFKDVFQNLIVLGGKMIFNRASDESKEISDKENQDNQSADQLVDDAKKLPDSETPVDDNWYKK